MPEVYRESRTYTRDRDSSPSDDEGYKKTTVRRYKVTPTRVERLEREVDVIEESRSRHGGRSRDSDLLEIDRRTTYVPERPRSSFDSPPRETTYVERRVFEREREREREPRDDHYTRVDRVEYRNDNGALIERERIVDRDERDVYPERERTRTVVLERERERDDDYYRDKERDRSRVVYESTKEIDGPRSPRDWERRAYWDDKETDVRIEKRIERRDDGAEVRIERRVEERRDDDVEIERWRKETEYYEPAPAPIVIRERVPEQKIIVHEAPPPPPVIIRERQEVAAPYIEETREEEYVVERWEETRHHHHHHRRHHHHHRHHNHNSEAESNDEYY